LPRAAIVKHTGRLQTALDAWLPRDLSRKGFLRIFLLALGVRLLLLAAYMATYPAQWRVTDFNVSEMGNIALNIYEGHGFSSPFFRGRVPTAWECPLVPYLWAAVMRLMGEATGRTAQMLVLLQSVPSALSVAFYWLIVRYLTRRMLGLRPIAAAVAGLMLCFWPESLLRLKDLWYMAWQDLGVVVLIWLGLRWCDRPTLATGAAMTICRPCAHG
jgi:hypothetical protein